MDWIDAVRAQIGRRLERGSPSTPVGRAVASAWAASARLARPLAIPRGLDVIGVGSAVLGGAGKTPVAIALALGIAANRPRIAFVSHAYRASPGRARIVTPADRVEHVGDDALVAARCLEERAIPVLVGDTREASLELAAALGAEVVVVDGLLQTSPRRLSASVLVLDGATPWGAGACPPLGDLRASKSAILAASDLVATLRNPGDPSASAIHPTAIDVGSRTLSARTAEGERVPLRALAGQRVGVVLAIARPERVMAALALQDVVLARAIVLGDHARLSMDQLGAAHNANVHVWLTTARCATKLPASIRSAPVLSLEHEIDAAALVSLLVNRLSRATRAPC